LSRTRHGWQNRRTVWAFQILQRYGREEAREEFIVLLKDKAGGPLLQAELEVPFGSGSPVLMADNGRHCFELDAKQAGQFYKLVSATKSEVEQLKKAGFKLECVDEFEARDG
jgi:hypothetical protein